uniref:Transcription factor TFIIIB component B'' Myb domain-containing protein n=1 Tax=Acrobeloides nanus TaxID=290746 RepID=A0A914CX71_9BILA
MRTLPSGIVDQKRHTFKDLAHHTPEGKNSFKQKISAKKKELKILAREAEFDKEMGAVNEPNREPKNEGPQLAIDEKGELVVDETSLKLHQGTALEEVFEDDNLLRKLTSSSFRKRPFNRIMWTKTETDMFYDVLGAVGTDFGLMHDYIPTRTRAQIKAKFNAEEKFNRQRIDECLQNPALLDDTELRRITQHYYELIERETHERHKAKESKKKKRDERNESKNENTDNQTDDSEIEDAQEGRFNQPGCSAQSRY